MTEVTAGRSAGVASRGSSPRSLAWPPGRWARRPGSAGVIAGGREIAVAVAAAVMAVGLAGCVVALFVLVQVIGLEVVEDEHVHLANPLGCVSLARGVSRGRSSEPVPRLIAAPCVGQRVGVGVVEPGRAWPVASVSELGDLQC